VPAVGQPRCPVRFRRLRPGALPSSGASVNGLVGAERVTPRPTWKCLRRVRWGVPFSERAASGPVRGASGCGASAPLLID
jgi:hypothetical protein